VVAPRPAARPSLAGVADLTLVLRAQHAMQQALLPLVLDPFDPAALEQVVTLQRRLSAEVAQAQLRVKSRPCSAG